ncbi:MAG: hypothetical protein IT317_04905 [Anaerolineales bacterium]|nr:hypothetical protein [Anaerolineales bacterium]
MSRFAAAIQPWPARALPWMAVAVPLAVAVVCLRRGAPGPGGAPMLPLDDAYIHLQYAWQTAHGEFMQYNPGAAPTSGATSLLYVWALAAGFALGLSRTALPAVEAAGGALLFAVSTLFITDLARRGARIVRADPTLAGLLALTLFGASGWMAWCFLSGMETGLLTALVAVALWAQAARRPRLLAGACGLAALTRPEAALLPLTALVVELAAGEGPLRRRRPALAGLLVALALAAAAPLLNWSYTGTVSASGLQAKSLFTLVPFHWSAVVSGVAAALGEIWLRLWGGFTAEGRWHNFPLLQVIAGGGALALARTAGGRRLAALSVGWLALGTAATATLQTALWHHYRYQMPFYPALAALGSVGLAVLAARARRRWVARALLAAAGLWGVYSTADFAREYARDTHTAAAMQLPLALWLRAHTPPEALIAAHDIGVIRYFGEHDTVDVVGLTSAGLAAAYRNGPGSLYEALRIYRPAYYAVYPDRAPPYFGMSSAAALLGVEVFRVQVADYSRVTSAGDTQVITQADWSSAAAATEPQQPSVRDRLAGLTLVGQLNVAELSAERAYRYAWWNAGDTAGFPTEAQRLAYRQDPAIALADGGRRLTGGERWQLSVTPGQPLLLAARLQQAAPLTLAVTINGRAAGEWRLPGVPGEWVESTFRVAPAQLTDASATVELTVTPDSAGAVYSPYFYWAYQGASTPLPTPTHPRAVSFGATAALLGFDLPQTTVRSGQAMTLTLYWQGLEPAPADLKYFVHLMDPANDSAAGLIAQFDAAPANGAEPFWTWPPGETRRETLTLLIPPATPPGRYSLLLGLYDAAAQTRLPFTGAPDFGSARLQLADITVRP